MAKPIPSERELDVLKVMWQLGEADKTLRRYGGTSLGLNALAARRLVQVGVRFVTIGMSGWDTHKQNFPQLRTNLLPQLDGPLSALIEDLDTEGLLKETIVYCVGEFNRTPHINEQGGRDHWARAMSVLIAGGGFKPSFIYGATDDEGLEPADNACSPADINTTILKQIGIGPDTKLQTRSGRPMALFREGTVIDDLYSRA